MTFSAVKSSQKVLWRSCSTCALNNSHVSVVRFICTERSVARVPHASGAGAHLLKKFPPAWHVKIDAASVKSAEVAAEFEKSYRRMIMYLEQHGCCSQASWEPCSVLVSVTAEQLVQILTLQPVRCRYSITLCCHRNSAASQDAQFGRES